ncbi:hypothetical protein PA7_17120 [Pseudonocardia asaccharolytica DSM 44247 = NBRC 16224]|uniref:Uncharacterized protein n=1 Tax=Pseudonocardia asaccharolytica DSM 44247 = NBRC 16224 TaxID=1123024 RepID=A0A511CZ91_9PSEU|nr:hypothetical protein PA7_17120 [Pseudonocardia asaccharolytica DSM 44247 = NBRC 16224]
MAVVGPFGLVVHVGGDGVGIGEQAIGRQRGTQLGEHRLGGGIVWPGLGERGLRMLVPERSGGRRWHDVNLANAADTALSTIRRGARPTQ